MAVLIKDIYNQMKNKKEGHNKPLEKGEKMEDVIPTIETNLHNKIINNMKVKKRKIKKKRLSMANKKTQKFWGWKLYRKPQSLKPKIQKAEDQVS